MSAQQTRRKDQGLPGNGGRYAETEHAEADASVELGLSADSLQSEDDYYYSIDLPSHEDIKRWGEVNVHVDSRTPWGPAQQVDHPAPGIAVASCAGHGGVKLSPQRNREIPAPLRQKSGWYEEDLEAQIVGMYFPEAFPHLQDKDEWHERFKSSIKNYYPDEYEKATGETIAFGESSERDGKEWRELNAGKPILYTTGAKESSDYPGVVIVDTRNADGDFERAMIPVADYQEADRNRRYGAARVDPLRPASAIPVPKMPKEDTRKPKTPVTEINTSKLTATGRDRADTQLDKLWRDGQTGEIYCLRDRIEAGKYSGKTVISNNGKSAYYLQHVEGSFVTPVQKSVWDAYQGPDTRSDSQRIQADLDSKKNSLARARDNWDVTRAEKLSGQVDALRAKYESAHESELQQLRADTANRKAQEAQWDSEVLIKAYAELKDRRLVG